MPARIPLVEATLIFLVCLIPAKAHSSPQEVTLSRKMETSVPFPTGGTLKVENRHGALHIEGWDGPETRIIAHIQTQATSREAAQKALDRVEVLIEPDELGVRVRTGTPRLWEALHDVYSRVEYVIEVPRGAAVEAETVDGSVRVEGVRGRVRAVTVNGPIRVVGSRGPLEIRGANGGIHVTVPVDIDADLEARTEHGAIITEFPVIVQGRLRNTAINGRIGRGGTPIHLRTAHGDVEIIAEAGRPLAGPGVAPVSSRHQLPASTAFLDSGFAVPAAAAREVLTQLTDTFPGLSVGVALGGRLIWAEGFGWANVEERRPATRETKYRIYSASKAITGSLVAKLAAEGRLDLDAPITQYVPYLPAHFRNVTCRQLSIHTGGVRHYQGEEGRDGPPTGSVREAVRIFADDPLLDEPGHTFAYSTYGYVLLSAVIEEVVGKPFEEALVAELFGPLRLNDITIDDPRRNIPGRSVFYEQRWHETAEGGLRPGGASEVTRAPHADIRYKWGGGALLSTAGDLALFASKVVTGDLLSVGAKALIREPQTMPQASDPSWSVGWIVEETQGMRTLGTGGVSLGGRSTMGVEPNSGLSIAILANSDGPSLSDAALEAVMPFLAFLQSGGGS